MTIVFWTCTVIVCYVYIAYPCLLYIASKLVDSKSVDATPENALPSVSIVVCARNEAAAIKRRIQNLLDQDYPRDRLEIIVVSDGSTDDTAAIACSMLHSNDSVHVPNLHVIELAENRGKPHALNLAVKKASHEVLVMADARQVFAPDAVRHLANALSDRSTGCVSGELQFSAVEGGPTGVEMGLYWRYERFIRIHEAKISSVVGMTGAIYAIRRELYEDIPDDTLIDDVLIPMQVVRKGYRAGFEPSAVAYDVPSTSPSQEWKRKVRTMAGNWQLVLNHGWMLSPSSNPILFQFLSHKVGRLLVPIALIGALVSSLILSTPIYRFFAVLQGFGYLTGLLGMLVPASRRIRVVSLAYFFILLNASVVIGLLNFRSSQYQSLWTDAHKDHHR